MLLLDLLHAFERQSLENITLSQLFSFISLASNIKRYIQLVQPARHPSQIAPPHLPPVVIRFLSEAIGISEGLTKACWEVCKNVVWETPPEHERRSNIAHLFQEFGWPHEFITLYPPANRCLNNTCPRTSELRKVESRQVVLHTLDAGTQPAWAVHLYCQDCHCNYHHNYYVYDGQRTYYDVTIPSYLQVSEHHFIERKLAEMWTNQHLFSACSATNCATIFMETFSKGVRELFEAIGWPFVPALTTDHVWDAFVLLALLRDRAEHGIPLMLPHTGSQKDRFQAAMQERNERIVYHGQKEISHYCDGCMRVYEEVNDEGIKTLHKCQVVVSDGITLGHPCCGFSSCTEPLRNNHERFCATHSNLNDVCAVQGCNRATIPNHKTCDLSTHKRMEALSIAKGKAAFSLRERLQRQTVTSPNDIVGATAIGTVSGVSVDDLEENTEWFTMDNTGVKYHFQRNQGCVGVNDEVANTNNSTCPTKSAKGNQRIKAQFGRRRTHNEQTLVRPCGVILARATFFNAEAVSNVLEFVRKAFSVPGAQKPEHFIYDTACSAKQQVEARNDEWWKGVGMCVDVWHLLNKHKTTHEFCQKHCNPSDYPELMDDDGTGWWFNTSVAEQINVWLGSYHAICREMLPVKYNFFLDEMIRLRNIITIASLEMRGLQPRYSPSPAMF